MKSKKPILKKILIVFVSFIGIIGLLIGVVRTIPKGEKGPKKIVLTVVNAILNAYVEFFRGTPMIVQAMVIYYGSDLAFGIDMDRTFAALFIVSISLSTSILKSHSFFEKYLVILHPILDNSFSSSPKFVVI